MTASDPTLALLASLDNRALYDVIENVPVFVPHKRKWKDSKGKEHTIEVTEDDLQEIAEKANQRESDTGTLAVLTLGHRKSDPDFPETDQPPLVGFARHWRVGTFGKKRKPCLLISEYVKKADRKEAGKYPFRSVEYYANGKEITAVSLLKRDPELDLGVVLYTGNGPLVLYSKGINVEPDNLDTPPLPADPVASPDPDAASAEPSDEEQSEAYQRHCYSHPYASKHYEKMCSKYGMADASATNAMPGDDAAPPLPGEPAPMGSPTPFARDSQAARYQRENANLKAELATTKKKLLTAEKSARIANYHRELVALQTAGVELEIASENKEVEDMTLEQFKKYKTRIAKHYSRSPVGGDFLRISDESLDGASEGSKEREARVKKGILTEVEGKDVLNYMRDHKCTHETAVEVVVLGKKAS